MKNRVIAILFFYVMFVVEVTIVSSCSKASDEGESGMTIRQSITLPAVNALEFIELNQLSVPIKLIEGTNEWLSATSHIARTGFPAVRIIATDNVLVGVTSSPRNCVLTITDANANRVILEVAQDGSDGKTDINNIHDVSTDHPAYAPQRAGSRGQDLK